MRRLVKAMVRQSIRALPLSARRFIFEELAKGPGLATNIGGSFKEVGDNARKLGLTGFVAEGESGVIRGALDDDAALATYARDGTWAPHERTLFMRLFAERGGTYLDIGANIGLTVIPIAQNPLVECYAFEPEPTNFRHLSENVAVNCRAGNVHLLNLALFDTNSTVLFEIAHRHSGDHRVSLIDAEGDLDEHKRQKIQVPAKRLDDMVTDAAKPIAAKIDVQGAEPFVIAGGRTTLSQATLLSLEFWPYSMHRIGGDVSAVIGFLTEHFQEGSISAGDKDEHARWQPITSIATLLHEFAKEKSVKHGYRDVLVRKT